MGCSYMYTCMHIYIYIYIYLSVHIYMYVYLYVYIYVSVATLVQVNCMPMLSQLHPAHNFVQAQAACSHAPAATALLAPQGTCTRCGTQ